MDVANNYICYRQLCRLVPHLFNSVPFKNCWKIFICLVLHSSLFCLFTELQKLNESDQYHYNGLVWRSAEQSNDGYYTVELYRDGASKPLCCSVTDYYNGNGYMSVPMSTTICRQLGYTTGSGICIDDRLPSRYTHTHTHTHTHTLCIPASVTLVMHTQCILCSYCVI